MVRLLRQAAVFLVLWWILSEGSRESWIIGLPAALAATLVGTRLGSASAARVSLVGALRFVPYFVVRSLAAGADIAWRAVDPRLPVEPRVEQYQVRLPDGPPRVFFVSVLSLLPGTVSVELSGDVLEIHVINARQPNAERLARLEKMVAALFAVRTADERPSGGAAR